jgi:hypothetical protein
LGSTSELVDPILDLVVVVIENRRWKNYNLFEKCKKFGGIDCQGLPKGGRIYPQFLITFN